MANLKCLYVSIKDNSLGAAILDYAKPETNWSYAIYFSVCFHIHDNMTFGNKLIACNRKSKMATWGQPYWICAKSATNWTCPLFRYNECIAGFIQSLFVWVCVQNM